MTVMREPDPSSLMETVSLGPDAELRIKATLGDQPELELRLYRRSAGALEGWEPNPEAIRLPLRSTTRAADRMHRVALRAAELLAVAPPRSPV